MRSKRSSILVPGFYKQKPVGSSATSTPKQAEKPPVVLRRDGLVAEIIRLGRGDEMLNREGINSLDSQETN